MKPIYHLLPFWMLCCLLTGCIRDDADRWVPPVAPEGRLELTLQVPRPGELELISRSMTPQQEHEVGRLELLTFQISYTGVEELVSTHTVSNLVRSNTDYREYTATLGIPAGTYSSVLLLANVAAPLPAPGTPRHMLEEQLLYTLNDGQAWDVLTPTLFPMWGELPAGPSGVVIGNQPQTHSGIKLVRMTARITLSIEQESTGTNPPADFTLDEVYLCNFRRNGRIVPTPGFPTATALPAVPLLYTQPLKVDRENIYVFEQEASDGAEDSEKPFLLMSGEYDHSGVNSWYRIDFVNRLHDDPLDPLEPVNVFLDIVRNHSYHIRIKEILGPGYQSAADAAKCKPFNTVVETLRFDDGETEVVQFDGKYFLSVSHDTVHFFKGSSTQTIRIKTDSPLGWKIEQIQDQQGGADPAWVSFSRTTGAGQAHPGDNGEVQITVDPYDNAATAREAHFTVVSGRLYYRVQIKQSHLEGISLEIVDANGDPVHELIFRSNPRENNVPLADQSFRVKWSGPQGCKINVRMIGNKLFEFETSGPDRLVDGQVLTTGEEDHTVTVRATPFEIAETDPVEGNPFMEKGAAVTFTVENAQDKLSQTLYIRHECISFLFTAPEELCYMSDETYTYNIRSNTSWTLSKVEIEDNLTGLFRTSAQGGDYTDMVNTGGGNNIQEGETFQMFLPAAVYDGASEMRGIRRAGRRMKLTFSDDSGILSDIEKTFIAIAPDANCYLLRNGGGTYVTNGRNDRGRAGRIDIPVRKLFWIWEKELGRILPTKQSDIALTADILWQTETGLIQNSLEWQTHGSTDYRDHTLRVRSGTGPQAESMGNALVAIRANNEVLWTFHLWVTDYFPDDGSPTFYDSDKGFRYMDWNLGATLPDYDLRSGDPVPPITDKLTGFFYQWGRKDPFPGAVNGNYQSWIPLAGNHYPLVDGNGGSVQIDYQPVSVTRNLANSIHNPTTVYHTSGGADDWYTDGDRSDQNDYLWCNPQGRKALYDPCPEGWQVPHDQKVDFMYLDTRFPYSWENDRGAWFKGSGSNWMFFPAAGEHTYAYGNYGQNQITRQASISFSNFQNLDQIYARMVPSDNLVLRIGRSLSFPVRCVKEKEPW